MWTKASYRCTLENYPNNTLPIKSTIPETENGNKLSLLFLYFLYFLFLLHPIDNTLVVQYQLVQGCWNYAYIIKKGKLEWRRAHYSTTNYGPDLYY